MKTILKKISAEPTTLQRVVRNRVNILKGQLTGLHLLIERDEDIVNIFNQSKAIHSGLSALESLVLEEYLRTELGTDKSRFIRELKKIFKK